MATIFVRHQVTDYPTWRRVFDDFAPTQKALGVLSADVFQTDGDPNEITVTHDFASMESAKAFAASPDLRAAMHDAGVVGAPTIWFTSRS